VRLALPAQEQAPAWALNSADAAQAGGTMALRADEAVAASGPALRLLVIDDDVEVRAALAAVLQRWGHEVLAAAGAEDALATWRRAGCPDMDAVLTDLRLHGPLDGVAAAQALREAFRASVPVLVISGDVAHQADVPGATPTPLQRLRDSGLPWLAKPVMPMRLRAWLAGLARREAEPDSGTATIPSP
jgi:CheY-like chemotaxis protein